MRARDKHTQQVVSAVYGRKPQGAWAKRPSYFSSARSRFSTVWCGNVSSQVRGRHETVSWSSCEWDTTARRRSTLCCRTRLGLFSD